MIGRTLSRVALIAWLPLVAAACSPSTRVDLETPWLSVAALVLLIGAAFWARRRDDRTMLRFSRVADARRLPPTWRTRLVGLPDLARLAALAVLVVAVGRPQLEEFDERAVEGIDIFVALDMSGSMAAVDLGRAELISWIERTGREPPDRFEVARDTLKRFVAGRERDRIGMVVFARDAFLQFPLTLDYGTIQNLLDRLRLEQIDASATAIGNALGLSLRGLLDSPTRSRTIILITDGKQQGGNISPMEVADIAARENIRIFSILVGREGPTLVPVGPPRPGTIRRYQEERYPVDPALLQSLAERTAARAFVARNRVELETNLNQILDELERDRIEDIGSVEETELFPHALGLALLLLLLDALARWAWLRRYP